MLPLCALPAGAASLCTRVCLFSSYHRSGSCKPAQFFHWAEPLFPCACCPHFLFLTNRHLKGESEFAGVAVRSAVRFSWVDACRVCVHAHMRALACSTVVPHRFVTKRSLNNIIKWLLPLSERCSYVCMHFFFFAKNVNLSWTERCPHKLIQPYNLSHLHF